MLRLFQAFLESAPQMVLQLYIMAAQSTFHLSTAIAAGCSTLSLIWTLVAYSRVLRYRRANGSLSCIGFLFQVLWRTCMVTSRVVALVLFATHFTKWLFVAVAAHWLIMTLWLICQRSKFCTDEQGQNHPFREKLFSTVIGFIYIFCFFNIREGLTRKRLVLFYSFMLVENSLLVAMWYPNRTIQGMAVFAALVVVWGGFALGVLCMILYYNFYHPSLAVRGIFVRKRTFDVEGRRGYTLVFCCCCQYNSGNYNGCVQSTDEVIAKGVYRPTGFPPMELEILPRAASRELYRDECGLSSDAGSRAEIHVHSTPYKPTHARRPLFQSEIPSVVVTRASFQARSPRDSISNSSLVTMSELELEFDTAGHISQPLQCTQIKSEKELQPEQCDVLDTCRTALNEQPAESLPASPLSADKLTNKLPDKDGHEGDTTKEDEGRVPPINYGSLSFGHRYSLVSSDCISLSSESSRSSLDSIIFEDDGIPEVRMRANNAPEAALTPRTADEGIFSDERSSPHKQGTGAQGARSQSSPLAADVMSSALVKERSLDSVASSPDDEKFGYLEYLMDAPSPPHVRAKQKAVDSASEKEDGMESESDWYTDASSDTGKPTYCSLEEIQNGANDSSPGPQLPKGVVARKRHTFDFSDLSTSKHAHRRAIRKRHKSKRREFDNFVVTYLKPGKYGSLRRSHERLAKIQEDTEDGSGLQCNSVIAASPAPLVELPELIDLPNGELSRDKCSNERKKKPAKQEFSDPFLGKMSREECFDRGTLEEQEVSDSDKESVPPYEHDIPDNESSSSQSSPVNDIALGKMKAEFVKRRRLKKFMSKSIAPGKFSSVRCSYERIPPDERRHKSHDIDKGQSYKENPAASSKPPSLEGHQDSFQRTDESLPVTDNVLRILAGTGRTRAYRSKLLTNGFAGNPDLSEREACLEEKSPASNLLDSSSVTSPIKRHTYDFSLLSPKNSNSETATRRTLGNDSTTPLISPPSPVWVHQPLPSDRRERRPRSAVLHMK